MRIALIVAVWAGLVAVSACSGPDEPGVRGLTNSVTPPIAAIAGTVVAGAASAAGMGPAAGRTAAAGAPTLTPPVLPAGGAGSPAPPVAGVVAPQAGMLAMAGMPAPAGGAGGMPTTVDRSPEAVCARWRADRANLSEGTWSGSVAACQAGDISADGRANALRLINTYRWLADLPAVESDPTMDKQAQACALLQRANRPLSHKPPMTWTCYNAEGATAAGRCNISTGPGVASVDGYMVDPGNPTTIGHRRWILSNTFGPTGLGSTDRHSCMMTAGKMRVGRAWQAWPAPGVIPLQAMQGGFGQKVDSTGWTVQSDTIDLAMAQVAVTADGVSMPVSVTQLLKGYGSQYALRFNPMGWSTTAGKTYNVAVTGTPTPIHYSVQIVDCE